MVGVAKRYLVSDNAMKNNTSCQNSEKMKKLRGWKKFWTRMSQNKGGRRGERLICRALAHSNVLWGLRTSSICRHLAIVELALLPSLWWSVIARGAAVADNDAVGTVVLPSSTKDKGAYIGVLVMFECVSVGMFTDDASIPQQVRWGTRTTAFIAAAVVALPLPPSCSYHPHRHHHAKPALQRFCCHCQAAATATAASAIVTSHGIGGIDIPAKMTRLAKSLSQE
jgi:hypothetical protein